MLLADDEYRTRLFEQVKISSQRLHQVRNGGSLSNVLDQQGPTVKRRFLEARRLSCDVEQIPADSSQQSSSPKIQELEEVINPSEALGYFANVKGNHDILQNRASFSIFPEIEQQILKNSGDEDSVKKVSIFSTRQSKSKSVPRLRGFSVLENTKKSEGKNINKNVMTQIWREEHETAMSKLHHLQVQQKLQAITDIEDGEKKNKKTNGIKELENSVPGIIIKSNFKRRSQSVEKMTEETNNISGSDEVEKIGSRPATRSVLKFRKDLSSECVYPNLKRIAQNLKTYRLGQVAEVVTIHDISKTKERKKSRERNLRNRPGNMHYSPKRVQIKFVSTEVDPNYQEKKQDIAFKKTVSKPPLPIKKNPADYSMRVLHEDLQFLERERDIMQQKLVMKTKDNAKNTIGETQMTEKRIQYKKWPLASNSHSLNSSVQGSDFIERQYSYNNRGSSGSIGDTSGLIRKYANFNSQKTHEILLSPADTFLRNHIIRIGKLTQPLTNGSNNLSNVSKEMTSLESSKTDLRPKFQRSMSQI